jgi:hypothetical protein
VQVHQRRKALVVRRLKQMHQLMDHDVLQALVRLLGWVTRS